MMWARVKFFVTWGLLLLVSSAIARTLRLRISGDETLRRLESSGEGVLFVTWHNSTVIPVCYFGGRGYHAIVSVSRDGELQSRLMASRGYEIIRGSSRRDGLKALLESSKRLKDGAVVCITPDGPKGPNKEVQPGAVQLAIKTGSPIVPLGVACELGKRVDSWDRHLIPYPFSRAALYVGEPVVVDAGQMSMDEWCLVVRDALNAADASAAEMIGSRTV